MDVVFEDKFEIAGLAARNIKIIKAKNKRFFF